MPWPKTRAIMTTCYSKTEQIVLVPLNKNKGPFKIGGFFAHPVFDTRESDSMARGAFHQTYSGF